VRLGTLLALLSCAFLAACAYKPVLNSEPVSVGRGTLEQYWILMAIKPMDYPAHAERKGIEGRVDVSCLIDSNGHVIEAEVVESVPAGVFERSALASARSMRFMAAPTNRQRRPARAVRGFEYVMPDVADEEGY